MPGCVCAYTCVNGGEEEKQTPNGEENWRGQGYCMEKIPTPREGRSTNQPCLTQDLRVRGTVVLESSEKPPSPVVYTSPGERGT